MPTAADARIAALLDLLGPGVCTVGAGIDPRYFTGYNQPPGCRPAALLRPRSVDEVSAALAACNRLGLAVVPQGGLTGLAGAALPAAGEVVLALERFSGIEQLDCDGLTVTVRAGTVLETLQREVDAAGFELGFDLGARGSCQIGGNLATNAGGNRAIRHGVVRDQVLGLEAVLADGSVVGGLNTMLKNNAGYDLKHLFIGSEGTLGVIVRAVLKLQPRLHGRVTCLCAVPDHAAIVALWRLARASLPDLCSFEVMWPGFVRYVGGHTPGLTLPWPADEHFCLLLECAGSAPDARGPADRLEAWLADACARGLVADAALAATLAQAGDLWRLREGLAIDELPNLINYDISLPIAATGPFAERCQAALLARWPDACCLFFGHLGDSNLHIGVSLPQLPPGGTHAVDAVVYGEVRALGGSISAEHGIGRYKRDFLDHSRSAADIALMRTLKRALDPRGILNPGKVF